MRFCDALWGAVVGRKPEFEVTSQILWVTSSRISFREKRIRSPQAQKPLRELFHGETEFASPGTKFEMTSLRGFVKSPRILVLRPTTAPQSASQNRIVDYIKCLSSKISFLSSLRLRELWFLSLAIFFTAFRAKTKFTLMSVI